MQEVVEVPGLVADPEVEALAGDQVVEDHEVVDEHLVHPPDRLERVQVVLPGLRLEVRGLADQVRRRGVHGLASLLEELHHRRLGEPLDVHARSLLAKSIHDGQVSADVAQPDRRAQVEHTRTGPRAAPCRRRGWRSPGDPVGEVLDRPVDHDRVAAHRQVAAALDDQSLRAGVAYDGVEPSDGLASVVRAVDDEHRALDRAQHLHGLLDGRRVRRRVLSGQLLRAASLQGPADGVLEELAGVGRAAELPEEELHEVGPVLQPVVAVVLQPPVVARQLLVEERSGLSLRLERGDPSRTDGAIATTPSSRSGCSAAQTSACHAE